MAVLNLWNDSELSFLPQLAALIAYLVLNGSQQHSNPWQGLPLPFKGQSWCHGTTLLSWTCPERLGEKDINLSVFVLGQAGPAQHHVTAGKEEKLNTVPLGFFSQCPSLYVVSHWVIGRASPGSKGARHRPQSSILSLLIIGRLFVSVSSTFSFCLPTSGRMCLNTDMLCWRVLFPSGKLLLSSS